MMSLSRSYSTTKSVVGGLAPVGPRLANKVAVITGCSAGIGKQSALLFAQHGAKVVAADKSEEVRNVVEELRAKGFDATAMVMDVSSRSDSKGLIELAEKKYGKVNIVFNNAGIMDGRDDDAVSTEDDVWDLTMNVNVKGVFYGCKYGVPALRRAGGGSIINTASFVALMGAATSQVAYTASKGAVLAFTRELAVIHARENIRVNALCPGPLKTELLMNFLNTEEKRQRRLVHVPVGRFGEAAEIANAALFLASDESSFITGSDFLVDGGITSAYVTPL